MGQGERVKSMTVSTISWFTCKANLCIPAPYLLQEFLSLVSTGHLVSVCIKYKPLSSTHNCILWALIFVLNLRRCFRREVGVSVIQAV